MEDFKGELAALISRHSKENGSNTPDFILAEFLNDCLAVYDRSVKARTKWYSTTIDEHGIVSPPAAISSGKAL